MRTSTTQPPLGTPINASNPLTKGLVGSWLLNEGGGIKAIDSTRINTIDGVLTNGPVYKQTAKGNAVLFDGSDDFITNPNNSFIALTTNVTLSVWVNMIAVSHVINQVLMKNSANLNAYGMNVNNSRQVSFQIIAGGSSIGSITSSAVLTLGIWYHICCVRNVGLASANNVTYINGVKDANTGNSTTAMNTSTTSLSFGTDLVNAGRQANMLLQDVKIYNRPLSQTEVWQLYTNTYQMYIGKVR